MQVTFLSMLVVCVSAECSGPHCHIDVDVIALLQTKSATVKGADRSEKASCNDRQDDGQTPTPWCGVLAFHQLQEKDRAMQQEQGVRLHLLNDMKYEEYEEYFLRYEKSMKLPGNQNKEASVVQDSAIDSFLTSGPDAADKCTEEINFKTANDQDVFDPTQSRATLAVTCKRTSTGFTMGDARSQATCDCNINEDSWEREFLSQRNAKRQKESEAWEKQRKATAKRDKIRADAFNRKMNLRDENTRDRLRAEAGARARRDALEEQQ